MKNYPSDYNVQKYCSNSIVKNRRQLIKNNIDKIIAFEQKLKILFKADIKIITK